ncbi:MAG: 5-guanidino-2-oxopentanoate decarboxylase [Alphaproteobacteria bacterium]|nr:5-guanidino-2-oxopentanoate decarboxylase [Alphaproteobacteria bacterium]
MTTLGQVLPRMLAARGIDVAFGIPGVHTVEMYRGLPGSGLRHVTPRHEQGAGFMADGYARATGRPAACFLITGPGIVNAAAALGQAFNDSIPMLAISSVNARAQLGRGEGRLHEMRGQSRLIGEVCGASRTILAPEALPEALDEALARFAASRPRPFHIEIPTDVLQLPADGVDAMPAAVPSPPAPAPAAIAEAARRLVAAQRPLLLLGGGAVAAAAVARDVAERLACPTLMTVNGRGALGPGHPLDIGGFLPFPPVRTLVEQADVVLIAGSELGPTDLDWGGRGPLPFRGTIIRIDIDPVQLNRGARPTLSICADARLALEALAAALPGRDEAKIAATATRIAPVRAAGPSAGDARYGRHLAIAERLWRTVPDALVAGDSTEPGYGFCLGASPPAPRRFFSSATGYGTLGYALPAAIGAKIARPEAPVIALIGDGGLQYTLPELAAAVEARAPVIVLLWNNGAYGEIRHSMRSSGVEPAGVELGRPDFQRIAAGFGCATATAATLDALAGALVEAAGADRPTLVEIDESRFAFT